MRKRKLLFTLLALGLGAFLGGSGAMAQNGWESVYQQSQYTTAWTAITSGNTDGMTLGASGQTTYYYVTGSYNFGSATNYGVSGLKIQGTVYLYIPYGVTISCVGGHANGTTGAGAGIELAAGTPTNTLYIIGSGSVTVTGGNAANGGNGGKGDDVNYNYSDEIIVPGSGGDGGDGGGGAGAGIGTRGGNGGSGGTGGQRQWEENHGTNHGVSGNNGTSGSGAVAMGALYVANGITVTATAGSAGSAGSGGGRGRNGAYDSYNHYAASGGGGGGGGGFGGAAVNIGTGGPGGGGGGGGAAGNGAWRANATDAFYWVGAGGGNGGKNGDGGENGAGASSASNGTKSELTDPHDAEYNNNLDATYSSSGWESGNGAASGGSGGGTGDAASTGTSNAGNLAYKITFNPVHQTTVENLVADNRFTKNASDYYEMTYNPASGSNLVLPANAEGYNWVLLTYGRSCAPNGVNANKFATATKDYFGGNGDEYSRTSVFSNVYGDLFFQEIPTVCMLECDVTAENPNNIQNIAEFKTVQYPVTVRLQNRTLYRDTYWNTICLPFAMTPDQIEASPLQGATIYKMNQTVSGYYADGNVDKTAHSKDYGVPVLLFWFDVVDVQNETLQAGKPYMVKWMEPNDWDDGNYVDNTSAGNTRHELDFPGVTVTATSAGSWIGSGSSDGTITFQGTFSPSADLVEDDMTKLLLGGGNKLYYPSETVNVGACRGYFIIPSAATTANAAPQLVMGFDDGETTDIRVLNVTPESRNDGAIYNLSGQRLNSLQKGVNIVNGKKVVVK